MIEKKKKKKPAGNLGERKKRGGGPLNSYEKVDSRRPEHTVYQVPIH